MLALDSRSATVSSKKNYYVTSEPQEDSWGQPPASHYVLYVQGDRLVGAPIAGVYATSPSSEITFEAQLAAEFAAWEAASDEAILSFEQKLI